MGQLSETNRCRYARPRKARARATASIPAKSVPILMGRAPVVGGRAGETVARAGSDSEPAPAMSGAELVLMGAVASWPAPCVR